MTKKIAINGFGRIGRLTLRNLLKDNSVEVVAINDLTDNATLAHLMKYDTAHGPLVGEVTSDENSITINGKRINSYSERDPKNLPWGDLGVHTVVECTGIFTSKEKASMHLQAGARKVLISAPGKGEDIQTIVIGVNDHELDANQTVFSNASCTTNCLAPVVKLLDQNFGIIQGSMSTIHAYTSDQNLQDAPHSDLRRARAAAQNIVPTSTGAAKAVKLVYPKIGNKIMAVAMRVPTITGSLVDLTVLVEKETSVDEVNKIMKTAAEGPMKGVLKYNIDPIVSSDIIGDTHSSVFDAPLTTVDGKLVRIVSWYDNEAGYSARLAQLTARL